MPATLLVSDAIALVRKNLDEAEPNGSVMYTDEGNDNASLDDIIGKNIPEAINRISLAAPTGLLAGVEYGEKLSSTAISDNVLSFTLSDSKFLRLVAFRAADSDIVITDLISEASPEGRKQLNKYIRGTFDKPRLVLAQNAGTTLTLRYYSLKDGASYSERPQSTIKTFSIVEEQCYASSLESYSYSPLLRQNILDCLTAMVMEIYSDERAQAYYNKANIFNL